ncbi:DUF4350 domain-containing protein [Polyangium sp. y55x31]|uniref:DUF4350 domain-containing protein n=1 Tax=Polyangium sp. y55x31 TaxID=3042688 RepID=UPI002482D349|nr:DUF4350 domain-containing protein [Polyangium sp. y55x31]MDI1475972.1 hypothetical protein [Polyangium sp. y55x31]
MAAGWTGPLTPSAGRYLALLCLLPAMAWAYARSLAPTRLRWLLWAAPGLLLLASAASDNGERLQVLGVVTALCAAALLTRTAPRAGEVMARVARSAALVSLLQVFLHHVPGAFCAWDAAADAMSRLAGHLSGQPLRLGPTFSGVWVALLFAFLALPLSPRGAVDARRARGRAAVLLLACAVAPIAYMALLGPIERLGQLAIQAMILPPVIHRPLAFHPGQVSALAPLLLLLALLVPAQYALGHLSHAPASPAPRRLLPLVLGGLALFGAGYALTAPLLPAPPRGAVIAIHDPEPPDSDRPAVDLSSPAIGRYGLAQAGMFGAFRNYLEAAGYTTRVLRGHIDPERLEGVDALVVINPQRVYTDAEHDAIWRYVDKGGGLLVLGDHTDLFGLQEPVNRLLEPIGIRFEFDSAFSLRRHWRHTQEFFPHAITAGLVDALDAQIGTGASLTLRGLRTRPILVGRYGFGDLGNRANGGQGGLLGDYRYELGERLGDMVLAADADHGKGRVVVFGDTSSFQSLSLPHAYAFVERTFRYVVTPQGAAWWSKPLLWLILAAAIALLVIGRPALGVTAAAAVLLVAADACHALHARPAPAPLDPGRLALVDTTHVGRWPLDYFEEGSMGGIPTALMRAGYLPVMSGRMPEAALDDAALAMFIAPVEAVAPATKARLRSLLERGGTLVVASGGRGASAANDLLEICGMRISDSPLGPAKDEGTTGDDPASSTQRVVQFVDAWAIESKGRPFHAVHARYAGAVVSAETRVFHGRCLAIGDGRFFGDKNLEGEFAFQLGNVKFLERLLEKGRR